jgi:putative DNA primase/helicase
MIPRPDNKSTSFSDALANEGLDYKGEFIPDGKIHRIKINGDKRENGWYVIHQFDGINVGSFGDFKRNISVKWCQHEDCDLSEQQKAERDRKWKQQQAERDADRKRAQDTARADGQAILDAATPAHSSHPYLARKSVQAHLGVLVGHWPQRQIENCLLIPLRTIGGELNTVQAILPCKMIDGRDKDFLRGGSTKGAHFVIGDLATSQVILIAEGYATAATLAEATGYAAVMAIDAGNLEAVAKAMRSVYQSKKIILCADNDAKDGREDNTGLKAAMNAAQSIQADFVVPDEPGDFNDLAIKYGNAKVKNIVAGKQNKFVSHENMYRGTDDSNAELFITIHGEDARWCPAWGKWLIWTGSHWKCDERLDIDRLAADVPKMLYKHASESNDSAQRKEISTLARKLENVVKRTAMITSAKHRLVVHHSELDKKHFLLNASNGTIDLETGKIKQHAITDSLTHGLYVPYIPSSSCPTWILFLSQVFGNDPSLIRFIQRAIGYSLTGDVREQVLLICHGNGSNGKSVFLNILRKLLGSLSWQAAPDLLMSDKNRRHPTEQADLFGKRVVICQETAEGRRFDEVLVKQLTGGDAITARRMHEDNWSFEPTHKLWLSTNHKPEIKGTDHAIWRRMRLIPFAAKFSDDTEPRKDPKMECRLTQELPGILAWAVQGCIAWQQEGLEPPAAVRAATSSYQAEMDMLAAWMGECCVQSKTAVTSATELYRNFSAWCESNGERAESQRKFSMKLTERGMKKEDRRTGIFYVGIGLASDREEDGGACGACGGDSAVSGAVNRSRVENCQKPPHPPHPPHTPPLPEKTVTKLKNTVCSWDTFGDRLITTCNNPEPNDDRTGCSNCGQCKS